MGVQSQKEIIKPPLPVVMRRAILGGIKDGPLFWKLTVIQDLQWGRSEFVLGTMAGSQNVTGLLVTYISNKRWTLNAKYVPDGIGVSLTHF